MSKAIVLSKGTVIDGKGKAPQAETSVLIEQGKISAVGAAADDKAAARPDLVRIDARGLTVMPGLIDAHCHITFDEPASNDELFYHRREGLAAIIAAWNVRKLLLAGVTGFLDADCIFDVGIDLRDAIEAGVVAGPRMAAGGNALLTSVGGTAGRIIPDQGRSGYARVVKTRDEMVIEVRRQIKLGVDWIKVHITGIIPRQQALGEIQVFSFDELRTICMAANDLGIPVVAHCRSPAAVRDAARAGVELILHATFMDEEALEAVIEAGAAIVPTFTFQANLADYGDKAGSDPTLMDIFRREIEDSSVMLRRAFDAGVPLLCGSESGFSLTPYGHWHAREMEVFVKALDLSPLQAIQCCTQNGARALKLDGQVGVIEPGQLADIIVVDGDPSTDITVLARRKRLKHVILDGHAVDIDMPWPQKRPIPGWRLARYSSRILDQALAES